MGKFFALRRTARPSAEGSSVTQSVSFATALLRSAKRESVTGALAEFASDVRFALAGGDAALEVSDLIGGQRSLAAAVGTALARECDALALSFA